MQDGDAKATGGPRTAKELYRTKRTRNLAVLGAIVALAVLFYVITIVRMT